jgi:hypothetical protein
VREADVLYANDAEALLVRGRLIAVVELAPGYAAGEQAADHDLLFIDPRNRVFLRADGAVVLPLSGSRGEATLETESLAWAREQPITVVVTSTAAGPSLHVVVDGGQDVSAADPEDVGALALPDPPRVHILGDRSSSQECADLRAVGFYRQL